MRAFIDDDDTYERTKQGTHRSKQAKEKAGGTHLKKNFGRPTYQWRRWGQRWRAVCEYVCDM